MLCRPAIRSPPWPRSVGARRRIDGPVSVRSDQRRRAVMRKPSAALVVACTALVMATIGTSVAATGYTITSSKQVKPGAISLANLSKSARKALHGTRGPAGPEGRRRRRRRLRRLRRRGRRGRDEPVGADQGRRQRERVQSRHHGHEQRDGPLLRQFRPGHHALRGARDTGRHPRFRHSGAGHDRHSGRGVRVTPQREERTSQPASRVSARPRSRRAASTASSPRRVSPIAAFC